MFWTWSSDDKSAFPGERCLDLSLDVVMPTGKTQPEVGERSLKHGGGFTRRESSSNFSADATCTKVDEKHMTGNLLTSYQIFMQSSFWAALIKLIMPPKMYYNIFQTLIFFFFWNICFWVIFQVKKISTVYLLLCVLYYRDTPNWLSV